jgi:hypothetical protein
MSAAESQTARGYNEPAGFQFSVFLPNRVGQLREIVDVLTEAELKILGLSVVDATDWSVLRMVLSEPDRGRAVLQKKGFAFTESRVLLVVLEEETSLSELSSVLLRAEINVHFAFPLTIRHDDRPVMALHVEDIVVATSALTRHEFCLLGDEDLADPT